MSQYLYASSEHNSKTEVQIWILHFLFCSKRFVLGSVPKTLKCPGKSPATNPYSCFWAIFLLSESAGVNLNAVRTTNDKSP